MLRIASPGPDHPLHDLAATRALEARALAAVPPHTLMRRAGIAAARLALALAPHARVVRIHAGPGNNGGDGLEAAVELARLGRRAEVLLAGAPATDDARAALGRARAAGVAIDPPEPTPLDAHDLAIDALLGLGARRGPEGALADAARALRALPCPVLAIDLPSGLHPDTGQPLGEPCVRADHTLTLLTLKPGLFTGQGRDLAGQVWWDTLGTDLDPASATARLGAGGPSPAPRRHAQHKGSFGDVAVVGGAPGMAGAALLAGRAAHAAGAGRAFVQLLDEAAAPLDPLRPELMLRRGWSAQQPPGVLAATTVVAGCGGGEAIRTELPRLLGHAARLVLDADALNAIAADTALQALLQARATRGAATVLTPHPLEAARLLGLDGAAAVQADRLAAAASLAQRCGAVVVLKGSGSVIAAPGRPGCINASGNAALASAGTGDVLAGWLGGLWAQAIAAGPGDALGLAFEVAARAAWQHGHAADVAAAAGHRVLRAADLVERLAAL